MIIYNTTFNVAPGLEDKFLEFLKEEYILDCLNTKLVKNPKFMKLLGDLPDEGSTYSLQFDCDHIEDYMTFETDHATRLQGEIVQRYGENCLFFSSVLQRLW
jgi:hypothetical protein